jgi:DNA-binding IclR family transcriptional regulator
MVQLPTAAKIINDLSHAPADPGPSQAGATETVSAGPPPGACSSRGVLDGAFAVLDALAHADDGLGLTALTCASGLAKTSAYRLAEQLVSLDAVQRVDQRYYIGARIGRIGQGWQPEPRLRRAAQSPVHALALQSGAVASLRILHEDRLRMICATARHGYAYMPSPADRESAARTATGRVLYTTLPAGDAPLPDCWSARQWRQLRESIRDQRATVVDHQEAFPGICCVSAPVWWPDGNCAGAVTAQLQAAEPTPNLRDLVVRAARRIGAGLQ